MGSGLWGVGSEKKRGEGQIMNDVAPLVSVCVPVFNGMPFIEERLETILCQTVDDWELIVCDSFSDDGTWEAL